MHQAATTWPVSVSVKMPAHGRSSGLVGVVGVGLGSLLARLEPEAVAVHFEDMDVMGQPVEQGAVKALSGEHAGPFVERQVRCDDC